jgi:hypothetical protein
MIWLYIFFYIADAGKSCSTIWAPTKRIELCDPCACIKNVGKAMKKMISSILTLFWLIKRYAYTTLLFPENKSNYFQNTNHLSSHCKRVMQFMLKSHQMSSLFANLILKKAR